MSTPSNSVSILRRQRGSIVRKITTFGKVLDKQDATTNLKITITEYLNSLTEAWTRFEAIQIELEIQDPSEETRREEIEESYMNVIIRAKALLQSCEPSNDPRTSGNVSPVSSACAPIAIKLPEMRLPMFDGTIENWTSYYDIFSSVIERNDNLTAVQKLQYLRSTLTGKAAACIKSLETTDSNYLDAIEILKEKFDCPRKTILRHCDAIQNMPRLAKDTPEAIDEMLDTLNQHLRALKNLGEPIESWNSFLVSTILSKINPETIWQWELTLADKNMPSYLHLISFLQKRANCSLTVRCIPTPATGIRNHSSATRAKDNHVVYPKQQIYFTSKFSQCSICDGEHSVRDCEPFNTYSLSERWEHVTKHSLCSNCLRAGHNARMCRSHFTCRLCNERHHTLLHQPRHSHTESRKPLTPSTTSTTTSSFKEKEIVPEQSIRNP
ncbi:uncharacterized protein LOC144476618 [Augochlora pura]